MNIMHKGIKWHIHGEEATNQGPGKLKCIEMLGDTIQIEVEHRNDSLYYEIPIEILNHLLFSQQNENICHCDGGFGHKPGLGCL